MKRRVRRTNSRWGWDEEGERVIFRYRPYWSILLTFKACKCVCIILHSLKHSILFLCYNLMLIADAEGVFTFAYCSHTRHRTTDWIAVSFDIERCTESHSDKSLCFERFVVNLSYSTDKKLVHHCSLLACKWPIALLRTHAHRVLVELFRLK